MKVDPGFPICGGGGGGGGVGGGGREGNLLCRRFLAKMCVKMKELGLVGVHAGGFCM